MEAPVQVEKYGKTVWETPFMDKMRNEHCMCLNCDKLKPGEPDHCPIAQSFFEICQAHGNAMVMTRCDSWGPKDADA
jgi:hypothetical protein